MNIYDTGEGARLQQNRQKVGHWNRWGPFLSERAWGTVREDYSAGGEAWNSFPHDHARSRAYRWNEDGLAGICDRHQYLCFALALWNGRDPFLKERLFGVTGKEGNHGEDVKEYYFYLDNTPTHSYMKYLYKYPQAEFPYERLRRENQQRSRFDAEFELEDAEVFNDSRYFDVVVEYAKRQPEDLLIRISVTNRGPVEAAIHILPTLWFRNTWSWGRDSRRPSIRSRYGLATQESQAVTLIADHWQLGQYALYGSGAQEYLFTENETNTQRVFGVSATTPYVKDAFHEYVVNGVRTAVNPASVGTKAALLFARGLDSGETIQFDLRLASMENDRLLEAPLADFDRQLVERRNEADEFYEAVLGDKLSADAKAVSRQAYAGLLWSKQYYHYVVTDWLDGDPGQPEPPTERREGRNREWPHLFCRDVISMPDKWEFPWFAAWDLGFHCAALARIDPQFAKEQIILMLREWYMHPNGQIPAYEWDLGDVNPPVLSMAARAVFDIEHHCTGVADYSFLERVFDKLLINFTWWVNRKDPLGKNVFQGGFLGMDNIGAFDRGKLPLGYMLGQADGTSWMAAFAKSMMSNALQLADRNPTYEDLASKFWEHFVYIANSMNSLTDPRQSLWDEQDHFFYDHLISANGDSIPVRARTMVGFVPLFGATAVDAHRCGQYPAFNRRLNWFIAHRPELVKSVGPMVTPGANNKLILGLVRSDQLRYMLAYMLDENEFLSPFGVRSVSRYHLEHPLVLHLHGQEYRLDYQPGESTTDLFGGNSNWRGPIWIPVNFLIILALEQYHLYYGNEFQVECPTGSGNLMNLSQVAREIARRVSQLFLRDINGKRPVFGSSALFNEDPHWQDLFLFYEYFHGETGRGCGASHQTGWTGLIAQLLTSLHGDST